MNPGPLLVFSSYPVHDLVRGFSLRQINGAAAEAPASHARAINSGLARSNVHHKIQLRAAHLIVILQAQMGLPHQLPKLFKVPLF
jgi:hypothetical protein